LQSPRRSSSRLASFLDYNFEFMSGRYILFSSRFSHNIPDVCPHRTNDNWHRHSCLFASG
jgi:hypothetical protein